MEYFVYALANPTTCKVFYIGKGKGNRPQNHISDYKRGTILNAQKHVAINACFQSGAAPKVILLKSGISERDAFKIERQLIRSYKYRLTNIANGICDNKERDLVKAQQLLKDLVPFQDWVDQRCPTPKEIEYYHLVKSNLNEIIDRLSGKTSLKYHPVA